MQRARKTPSPPPRAEMWHGAAFALVAASGVRSSLPRAGGATSLSQPRGALFSFYVYGKLPSSPSSGWGSPSLPGGGFGGGGGVGVGGGVFFFFFFVFWEAIARPVLLPRRIVPGKGGTRKSRRTEPLGDGHILTIAACSYTHG